MSDVRAVVAVFAKPPEPGLAKTRLAVSCGPTRAAELAAAFLADTWSAVSRLVATRVILASTKETRDLLALDPRPEIWLQGEGDLGARIERIARRGLDVAPKLVALGADTPGLPNERIERALAALDANDAVLGPADDGGFYLIGLRTVRPGLLSAIPWSSPITMAATRARMLGSGMRVRTLDPWFDVDDASSLARLEEALAAGRIQAPRTGRILFGEAR